MFQITWRQWLIVLVAIVLPATALGGRFQVRPVKIFFDARTKITSFKVISSEEKNILTLQIQTVTWSQDDQGKDQYGDTKDLLVFPKLFKLQPRSERVVRVAFRAKKDPRREHTYRIFVEELPVEGRGETTITITLKLGMPVFVQPAQGKDDWSIEGLTLEKGRARVAIGNNGNQHLIVREIAAEMQRAREGSGRILVVGGPAIVHTGSREHISGMIRNGYINLLFAGNALAAHDIEQSFFDTSLGISMTSGGTIDEGHEHHLRSINRIRRAGGIREAVEAGILKSGIMYECVKHDVPYLLAGSIRDDGPLPDVVTDAIEAQRQMRAMIPGVTLALMIATTLHSIAGGNLLPARVKVVCVDINPATVTKLADRGTFQTVGLVTDVEPFLRVLAHELGIE